MLGLAATFAGPTLWAQQPAAPQPPRNTPTISDAAAAGHRLWVLLFDINSMDAVAVPRAKLIAGRWISSHVGTDDYVTVLTVGASVTLLANFTTNADQALDGVAKVAAAPATAQIDGASGFNEHDFVNNDLRYRGLRQVCTSLQSIVQKKALMFFTAQKDRPGQDNQVEVRAATEACNRANTSINPIDVTPQR